MGTLALVRHGTSTYNKKGLWAGLIDADLTPEGEEEAKKAGQALKDIHFNYFYSNKLIRSIKTCEIIQSVLKVSDPIIVSEEINERNYGDFSGKNKWEIEKELGEGMFEKIHRSWDIPIPGGESLKDVYERTIPYLEMELLSTVKKGENICVVSSGNALRSMVKYLEKLDEQEVEQLEFGLGEVWIYSIDANGEITHKEVRAQNPLRGKI